MNVPTVVRQTRVDERGETVLARDVFRATGIVFRPPPADVFERPARR